MRLAEYMQQAGLKDAGLAEVLGVRVQSIARYRTGQRVPRPDVMRRIVEITGGAVRPDDFYLQREEVGS